MVTSPLRVAPDAVACSPAIACSRPSGRWGAWRMTRAECVAPSQRRRNAPTSSPSQMMRSLSTGAPESLSDGSPPLLRLSRP